ncbi:MAG: hypothetical protein E7H54_05135 [Clostridium perfringens]|uniref:hypothetical protein n=1 Tax=Clostridium perfringens TaxID=1502 RepID=UPI0024BC6635|nr:hypothetical protein [Clostridium perfringens]MDU8988546.1 hypothetical protein [Clostridium perfringens]
MHLYEFVRENKELIRERLIKYNIERGEFKMARYVATCEANKISPVRKHNRRSRIANNEGQLSMI